MNQPGTINASERHGNLHIRLDGYFSQDFAHTVTRTISSRYNGHGYVFIHTNAITGIEPQSQQLFTSLLAASTVPGDRVYLTGDRGTELCHDQGRIIQIPKKQLGHRCSGRCKNCRCQQGKEHGHEHHLEHDHEHHLQHRHNH